MRKPTEAQLETAIAWLRCNEGDDGEADDCNRVADWLREQIFDGQIRKAARDAGVPVAKVRARLEAKP